MPYTNERELEQLDAQIEAAAHVEQQHADDEAAQALEEHRREQQPPAPGEPERPGFIARALGALVGAVADTTCPTCAGSCQIPNNEGGEWSSPPEPEIAIRCRRDHYCKQCHLDEQARERDPRPERRPCPKCWGFGRTNVPLRERMDYARTRRGWDERDGRRVIFWRYEDDQGGVW